MTDAERQNLRAAVEALNTALANLHATYGDNIRVVPFARYNDDIGFAAIEVEVSTGRERFGPPR